MTRNNESKINHFLVTAPSGVVLTSSWLKEQREMLNQNNVSSEQLGHLGLVAATIKELGIIDRIDAR